MSRIAKNEIIRVKQFRAIFPGEKPSNPPTPHSVTDPFGRFGPIGSSPHQKFLDPLLV